MWLLVSTLKPPRVDDSAHDVIRVLCFPVPLGQDNMRIAQIGDDQLALGEINATQCHCRS